MSRIKATINPILLPSKLGDLSSVIAGAMLTLSFAPFNLWLLGLISPLLLLALWNKVSAKRAFWRGLLFGMGLFGTSVSWVFISIHRYGNTNISLAAIITTLFVLILSLMPALQGYCFRRWFSKHRAWVMLLAFPSSWVLFEWLRGWMFTGFPWVFIGYSQTDTVLSSYAPLLSVYGVSWLLLFSSVLIYLALTQSRRCYLAIIPLFLIWGAGFALQQVHWSQPTGKQLSTSLIQGNIPQEIKWQPDYFSNIVRTYARLTKPHWSSNLIIWPEGALPIPESRIMPLVNDIANQARQHNNTVMTGIIKSTANGNFYNALIMLGDSQGQYLKRHLVPFGEYVPFDNLLRGLIGFFNIPMSNLVSGPRHQPNLSVKGLSFAPFICYEIAYPQEVIDNLNGAQALLTVSDDSWFGQSIALAQHLQMGQMRAIETARPLVFASNDGITAFVNQHGKILSELPKFTPGVLTDKVTGYTGTTPIVAMGLWPLFFFLWLCLLVALFINKRKTT